jgi:predicted nucleic acid-binding Zn ribbon protein
MLIRKYRDLKEKKPRALTPANALFQSLLEKLGYQGDLYAVFDVWDRLLGAQATRARATGLRGTRLCVEVDSSARIHDLMLRKRKLLKDLNQHFGPRTVISDIIFELADRKRFSTGS